MIVSVVLLFVMVLVVDAILIITPWLMPDSECFAITVPHGERAKEPLKGLMREYAVRLLVVSALFVLAWPVAFLLLHLDVSTEQGAGLFALVITLSTCGPVLASFVLMLYYRRLVQDIKREKGWHPERVRSATFVGAEDFPRPISSLWYLAYIPLIVAMVSFALLNYDRFPDVVPVNVNFDGVVTNSAPKSLPTLLFPVLLTVFMGVVFFGSHIGLLNSKKPIDPDAPASSALAYGRFARTQSIMMLASGLALSAATGVTFYASALGSISMVVVVLIEMAAAFIVVGVVLITSLCMGQSGGRIAASAPNGSMSRDDDGYWKLGSFYVNRDDPSIFVPKRFGVGWTLNLGNWMSWAVIAAFSILTACFVVASALMMS